MTKNIKFFSKYIEAYLRFYFHKGIYFKILKLLYFGNYKLFIIINIIRIIRIRIIKKLFIFNLLKFLFNRFSKKV